MRPEPRAQLTGVLFPGVVRDVGAALACFGGERQLSQVHSQAEGPRLALRLSGAPRARRALADCTPARGLLLRVRVRRRRAPPSAHASPRPHLVTTRVLGEVTHMYRFQAMMDFAVLPVWAGTAGDAACVLRQLVPGGRDSLGWIKEPAPPLMVAGSLTRSDRPLPYRYADKKYGVHEPRADLPHHVRLRPERAARLAHVVSGEAGALPTTAPPAALRLLDARLAAAPPLRHHLQRVRQALSERPLWSRGSLQHHTRVPAPALRLLLPALAVYFRTGPWRLLWARLGYDPREHPEARRYQLVDFRVRHIPRGDRAGGRRRAPPRDPFSGEAGAAVPESAVVFRAGQLPPQRQLYYQLCDVRLAEVAQLVEASAGAACHARRGWLLPGTAERVRALMHAAARRPRPSPGQEGDEHEGAAEAADDGAPPRGRARC